jgi:hypothetical protein
MLPAWPVRAACLALEAVGGGGGNDDLDGGDGGGDEGGGQGGLGGMRRLVGNERRALEQMMEAVRGGGPARAGRGCEASHGPFYGRIACTSSHTVAGCERVGPLSVVGVGGRCGRWQPAAPLCHLRSRGAAGPGRRLAQMGR